MIYNPLSSPPLKNKGTYRNLKVQVTKMMSYLCTRKQTHRYLVCNSNLKTLMSNPQKPTFNTMGTFNNNSTWGKILNILITILTAIATTFGAQSCM